MTPLRNSGPESQLEMEVDTPVSAKRPDETPDEKKARRKVERNKRKSGKVVKQLSTPGASGLGLRGALETQFNRIFDKEAAWVLGVQQVLPEVRHPHLQDDEDEKLATVLEDDGDQTKTEEKRRKFQERMKLLQATNNKGSKKLPVTPEDRAHTHEELKARLHAKIEALSQKKNEKKRLQKLKKKERNPKESKDESGAKKFISKANPNLKNQSKSKGGDEIKEDVSVTTTPKTPLRKKPVVKSNGEIVYSKFDFISQDDPTVKKIRPKAEDLLKRVQKGESKVRNLEASGRTVEAASIVESQKWDSALKRAQGEKIRDDVTLLKKTIKKQDKRKQVSKKKWQERTEQVDKLKEAKQDKRKANIQARKDDRVKKTKKQQRKKGRMA